MRLAYLYLGGQTDRLLLSLPLRQPLYAQVRSENATSKVLFPEAEYDRGKQREQS